MEPGEYLTNVLSFNNYASINYEYFEPQATSSALSRKHIQRLEAVWRREGKLVHCDPLRDGVWIFEVASRKSESTLENGDGLSRSAEIQGLGIVQKDIGTYEPANLARNKQTISNLANTPSTSSSPSSSMDSTVRGAQNLNARSTQINANLTIQEPPTPSPGTKSAVGLGSPASLKNIHEYFISAVLGSIVYFLCRDHNFIPLNSRTLILTNSRTQTNDIELATLDISLTSLGSLVVKAHSDKALGLQSIPRSSNSLKGFDGLMPGAALWLAPGGNAAKFYCFPDSKDMPVGLGNLQLQENHDGQHSNDSIATTIKSWQTKCLEWLSVKGMDSVSIESGGWVFVQIIGGCSPYLNSDIQKLSISDELAIVPWPALLCFQTSRSKRQEIQAIHNSLIDRHDPLSFAEDWFARKDERANIITKRAKERQAADSLSREQADTEVRAAQSHPFSSAILRRGSNAGAMYPTPPDAPHHIVGATPSFDGNVSTPGNPNAFTHTEIGGAALVNAAGVDIDTDMWDSSTKKERNSGGLNLHEIGQENDNLFGDLGADIFGTDVTDADFSFFDEPDAIQIDEDPNLVIPKTRLPDQTLPIWKESLDSENQSADLLITDAFKVEDLGQATLIDELAPQETQPLESVADIAISEEVEEGKIIIDSNQSLVTVPFNKETVFSKLTQGLPDSTSPNQHRRASLFNQVHFEKSLISVNEKYGSHGRFKFSTKGKSRASGASEPATLPQTEYLGKRQKIHDSGIEMKSLARMLVPNETAPPAMEDAMDFLIDSDGGSQISDQDDTSPGTGEILLLPKVNQKRKWENDLNLDITLSFDSLAMDYEQTVTTPQSIHSTQLPFLDSDPADWSLVSYFASQDPDVRSSSLSDLERIATAQILADQAVSSTLPFPGVPLNGSSALLSRISTTRKLIASIIKITKFCLDEAIPCSLRSFIEIQGIPVLSQALRLPPRPIPNPRGPNSVDPQRLSSPYSIPPPLLEVRRSDSKLAILPSAIKFWENLGLGPSKGSKDIQAVCVYPNLDGLTMNANIFLDQMRSAYESSRLGSHDRLTGKDIQNGLAPFAIDPTQYNQLHNLAALKEITGQLSRSLASSSEVKKNFVVYFIYPDEDSNVLVHICSAFQHLFNMYRKLLAEKRLTPSNELVLQLIPFNFVASSTSLSVPLPSDYFGLSIEVYDRCTDFSSTASTPAIMLEQPLPKAIDFKLSATPSASVLHENTCLHIAYAQSIDDRWITAAWTDNRGTQQMTASYCLGRKNEPISMPFSNVANEIWGTTLDFISTKRIHWRIMIVRVGVMDPSEIEFWTSLASTESNAQISLTLITVQTDPSLRLLPPPSSILPNGASTQSVATPVTTPQALQSSVLSPETATPPPTRENPNTASTSTDAPVEPDSDARLLDFTDQTFGCILSHRLNNSNSLIDLNPALISGYLIKRGGTNSEDPPIVMEVNIIHSEVIGNPRTFHESLLKEILVYYRGLGTLARVRGVVEPIRDVRPWHVAAVEKAVKALYMLM